MVTIWPFTERVFQPLLLAITCPHTHEWVWVWTLPCTFINCYSLWHLGGVLFPCHHLFLTSHFSLKALTFFTLPKLLFSQVMKNLIVDKFKGPFWKSLTPSPFYLVQLIITSNLKRSFISVSDTFLHFLGCPLFDGPSFHSPGREIRRQVSVKTRSRVLWAGGSGQVTWELKNFISPGFVLCPLLTSHTCAGDHTPAKALSNCLYPGLTGYLSHKHLKLNMFSLKVTISPQKSLVPSLVPLQWMVPSTQLPKLQIEPAFTGSFHNQNGPLKYFAEQKPLSSYFFLLLLSDFKSESQTQFLQELGKEKKSLIENSGDCGAMESVCFSSPNPKVCKLFKY